MERRFFIAELCKDANLKVLYNPDLKLDEVGSVSTGKVNIKNICKYNFEGLKYNYNKFYKKTEAYRLDIVQNR